MVVSECGSVPIAGRLHRAPTMPFRIHSEPTITGLAVGLAVTGAVPAGVAFVDNKRLEVTINDGREIALVDVAS